MMFFSNHLVMAFTWRKVLMVALLVVSLSAKAEVGDRWEAEGVVTENDEVLSCMFEVVSEDETTRVTDEWELLRFCTKLGYHIPGAAGKMLKHFERTHNPTSLISYADRRWSRGKMYESLGFALNHISEPNYWYLTSKMANRFSRQKFQKKKLKDILVNYDPKLTEVENVLANGYDRIFDCGNLVYIKTYN